MTEQTDIVTARDLPVVQYFVKKHNLRFVESPFRLFEDDYQVKIQGTSESINAFNQDMVDFYNNRASLFNPVEKPLTRWDRLKNWLKFW